MMGKRVTNSPVETGQEAERESKYRIRDGGLSAVAAEFNNVYPSCWRTTDETLNS